MSYKTLLVHLQLGQPNTALLKIAGDLAERLQAGVIGITLCQPVRIIYNDGYVPDTLIDQDRQEIDAQIKAAEQEFHAALDSRAGFAEWRSAVIYRSLSQYLAQEARCADLIITSIDENASSLDASRHVDMGDFVMQAGRPCLIVPASLDTLLLEHAVIGWKDSSETRRAIRDALPLLRAAGRVTVVEVAPEADVSAASNRLQDVVIWLQRHGISATPVAAPSTGNDVSQLNTIMQEQGAHLLVAGAYGHSRVREWALGGVTRDLLLRATRCALVSH